MSLGDLERFRSRTRAHWTNATAWGGTPSAQVRVRQGPHLRPAARRKELRLEGDRGAAHGHQLRNALKAADFSGGAAHHAEAARAWGSRSSPRADQRDGRPVRRGPRVPPGREQGDPSPSTRMSRRRRGASGLHRASRDVVRHLQHGVRGDLRGGVRGLHPRPSQAPAQPRSTTVPGRPGERPGPGLSQLPRGHSTMATGRARSTRRRPGARAQAAEMNEADA